GPPSLPTNGSKPSPRPDAPSSSRSVRTRRSAGPSTAWTRARSTSPPAPWSSAIPSAPTSTPTSATPPFAAPSPTPPSPRPDGARYGGCVPPPPSTGGRGPQTPLPGHHAPDGPRLEHLACLLLRRCICEVALT